MNVIPPDWQELPTPCLVLDQVRLGSALTSMQLLVAGAGKQLRPHGKSHKCTAIARRQREAGAVGLCVATLDEAEAAVAAGLEGLLLTTPLASSAQARRLARLAEQSPTLMATVDSLEFVRNLEKALHGGRQKFSVLIDLDVGQNRTGCSIEQAGQLAAAIDKSDYLKFVGLQAYTGHLQHIHSMAERTEASCKSLAPAASLFRQLSAACPTCTIFTGGGTGTVHTDVGQTELTEFQTGSYALMDAEYADVQTAGSQTLLDCFPPSLCLLTTVLSRRDEHAVIDCGLKSVYQDGARPRVMDPAFAHLQYEWFGDEFGKLTAPDGGGLPPQGTQLRLLVSHCDPTVALYRSYFAVDDEGSLSEWPIDMGRGRLAGLSVAK